MLFCSPVKPPPPPAKKLLCLRDSKVYVAVGYGGYGNAEGEVDKDIVFCQEENCVFVEGETGTILLNGLTRKSAAADVRDGFRQVLPAKPIKTAVTMGVVQSDATKVFFDGLDEAPEVLAHEHYDYEVAAFNESATKMHKLTERMPRVEAIPTTETFSGHHSATIDGVDIEFVSAGVHDQFFVWLPKHKILVAPDLFDRDYSRTHYFQAKYHTAEAIKMIEQAASFPAETLVPLHKYPVAGSASIQEYLSSYKDAIKFSHDQTIQFMNQGYYPDDIVGLLKSPPPHLKRFLATVNDSLDWRVRSVFNSYLGWFSGKASELHSMDPADEADGVMRLVRQDSNTIVKEARQALDKHDDAWALKLSQYLLDAGRRVKEAMALKKTAMRKIRKKSVAMPQPPPVLKKSPEKPETMHENAVDSDDAFDDSDPAAMERRLADASNEELFAILGLSVDVDKCADLVTSFSVEFTDEEKTYYFELRTGVLERLSRTPTEPSRVAVKTTGPEWRRIVLSKGVGENLAAIVADESQVGDLTAILDSFDLL